jgi:hypothetical protein
MTRIRCSPECSVLPVERKLERLFVFLRSLATSVGNTRRYGKMEMMNGEKQTENYRQTQGGLGMKGWKWWESGKSDAQEPKGRVDVPCLQWILEAQIRKSCRCSEIAFHSF